MYSKNVFRITKIAFLAVAVSLTTGCSWLQSLEVDPTKDWSANQLYQEARAAMNDSNWETAQDYYTKLESRYPFGAYAQQAQIDLAYVYWKDGEAEMAVQTLDRFLRAYPNHPNSDYALYLKALATLNQKDSWLSSFTTQDLSELDSSAMRSAFDIFKELAGRFPDSRYAPEARRRMNELVLAQARHEIIAARFYYSRQAYLAAINRAKIVINDFQTTPMRDEALYIMADSYHQLGLFDLEQDVRKIIETNNAQAPEPIKQKRLFVFF